MKRLAAAFVSALLCSSITFAATCEEMAVSKEGKPLHGAAKAASIKKCMKDNPAATPATPATPAEPAAMPSLIFSGLRSAGGPSVGVPQ